MLKGKMIRVRVCRHYEGQRPWAFVGKVDAMSENWIVVTGKGLLIHRGKTQPVEIDEETRKLVFPREMIANIRVLPDSFSLDKIDVVFVGTRVAVRVDEGPDTWISEVGED